MFSTVFSEAANSALKSILNHLKIKVFTDDSDDESGPRPKSPPLARLLPQLKFAALRLLPTDPSAPISVDVMDMISSPVLDTLCVLLFDLGLSSDQPNNTTNITNNTGNNGNNNRNYSHHNNNGNNSGNSNGNNNGSGSSSGNGNGSNNLNSSLDINEKIRREMEKSNGNSGTNWPH